MSSDSGQTDYGRKIYKLMFCREKQYLSPSTTCMDYTVTNKVVEYVWRSWLESSLFYKLWEVKLLSLVHILHTSIS